MPRETPLMATRGDDAELVLVETDQAQVTLHLDDGDTLTFDRTELATAITGDTNVHVLGRAA